MDGERTGLPSWQQLPDLELYMDQLLSLVARYLPSTREDKGLTAAMVNNYVKQKVLPAPVNKRYDRSHLAALLMLCAMKSVLPIAAIQRVFTAAGGREGMEELYGQFREEYMKPAPEGLSAMDPALSRRQRALGAALAAQAAQALALELIEGLEEKDG